MLCYDLRESSSKSRIRSEEQFCSSSNLLCKMTHVTGVHGDLYKIQSFGARVHQITKFELGLTSTKVNKFCVKVHHVADNVSLVICSLIFRIRPSKKTLRWKFLCQYVQLRDYVVCKIRTCLIPRSLRQNKGLHHTSCIRTGCLICQAVVNVGFIKLVTIGIQSMYSGKFCRG